MAHPRDFTVVIPTYGRHEVLVETVKRELSLEPPPASVIVVDQTSRHPPDVERQLRAWRDESRIHWMRHDRPSQPVAMNVGLLASETKYVLFHDDDLIPRPDLIRVYADSFTELEEMARDCWCIAGQVLQPGQQEEDCGQEETGWFLLRHPLDTFRFNDRRRRFIQEASAGNLCVDRRKAIALGGLDENFVGTAHKCDTDFARRVVASGGRVLYEPRASIRHLSAPCGGVRSYGNHLRTWKPHHPVGYFYIALRSDPAPWRTIGWLLVRCVTTRHHLRRPWFMPSTAVSNLLALAWALRLNRKGPTLIAEERTPRTATESTSPC